MKKTVNINGKKIKIDFTNTNKRSFVPKKKEFRNIDNISNQLYPLIRKSPLIQKGADYFKNKYENSPFAKKRPEIYLNLLIDLAKTSLNAEECYKTSIEIIDYEFAKLKEAHALNKYYSECYNLDHSIIKTIIIGFNQTGLNAAEAGAALAELCIKIGELPKKEKTKYKSWEAPYEYHR